MTPLVSLPPDEALTKLTCGGKVSLATTLDAVDGPALLTIRVYTKLLPTTALAGPSTSTTTSAAGTTLVVTCDLPEVPLLFVGVGSGVGLVESAMFVNEPLSGAV